MTQRKVTVIPAIAPQFVAASNTEKPRRRVAAYARVSTDEEEQLTSYEAQVDYYTQYIQSKEEWEFIKVYTDEGITGTNTKKRDGFNQMIRDALDGKIDLIITKSVSRFARNTVDTLTTVRKLKEQNVEVYFEKENINTLDSKGELLITIMSSLAQEESRSISENVTWGKRKRFADGKVTLAYSKFLGYEKGPDGIMRIVESQARIVRRIYKLFLDGQTPTSIAKQLTQEKVPTPAGKTIWRSTTVKSILQNEKYKGSALLQKTFTVDFLNKKVKVNEGEVDQYYIEHSHPAIISPEVYDEVQDEFERRSNAGGYQSSRSCFSNKLICGDCGSAYGSKVWHSTSKYKRTIWQCNAKFKNEEPCSTPHLYETEIQDAFLEVYNGLLDNKEEGLNTLELAVLSAVSDAGRLDAKLESVQSERQDIETLLRTIIQKNARNEISQDEFEQRYAGYLTEHKRLLAEHSKLEAKQDRLRKLETQIQLFKERIDQSGELLTAFDSDIWNAVINHAVVHSDGEITFVFRHGAEVAWQKKRLESAAQG